MYVNERNIIGRFLPLPLGKWIPIHGKLYHFSQERITFAKAKATCEHNFGKLFEPKTETINNDIAVRARRDHEIINPWIGIRHLHDENRTVFVSDNTEVAWSYWDANEPNNENTGEDCTHLYTSKFDPTAMLKECTIILDTYYNSKFLENNIGNGNCQDKLNTQECAWDGGDCCGDNVNTLFCSACECLEPDLLCNNLWKIADGICNDESNTEECKWDGGDCCGDNVNIVKLNGNPTCSTCECLEPSRWNDNSCEEFRKFICEKEGTG